MLLVYYMEYLQRARKYGALIQFDYAQWLSIVTQGSIDTGTPLEELLAPPPEQLLW